MTDPTPAEMWRRIDEIVRRLDTIVDRMDRQQAEAASTYVRQDVWARDRQLVDAHVADIRHDIGQHAADIAANRAAWRDLDSKINDRFRQGVYGVVASLLLPVIAGLVLWALTARGGL